MRKKTKNISDTIMCLEAVEVKDNVIKGVKVLGVESKNGRKYPLSVMEKNLHKYEGAIVALDHVRHDKQRSVTDIFGRIRNPRMTDTGIVADLEYNNQHQFSKAFEYFVKNDPGAVGLSHEAIAKTKMDYKTGDEIVEDIVEVEAVSLVANPATNPKGLFESYNKIMENIMKKDREAKVLEGAGAHEVPNKKPVVAESDSSGVEKKSNPQPHVVEAEDEDKKHDEKPEESMHEEKEYETFEAYMADMKEAVKKCMNSDMDEEAKCEAIMNMFVPKDMDMKAEEVDNEKAAVMDAKESVETKEDAENFIRLNKRVGFKLLLEELDAYRTKDSNEKLQSKVLDFCKKSHLDEKLVTEAFVDVLCSVDENKWKKLVEDRKNISASKAPISYSADRIAGANELTVDGLMKALRG